MEGKLTSVPVYEDRYGKNINTNVDGTKIYHKSHTLRNIFYTKYKHLLTTKKYNRNIELLDVKEEFRCRLRYPNMIYSAKDELEKDKDTTNLLQYTLNPLVTLYKYIISPQVITDEELKHTRDTTKIAVLEALEIAAGLESCSGITGTLPKYIHHTLDVDNASDDTITNTVKASRSLNQIPIKEIDQLTFNTTSTILTVILRILSYPTVLIKTRVQTDPIDSKSNIRAPTSVSIAKEILQQDGYKGLFRGFAPTLLNTLVRQPYFIMYEHARSSLRVLNCKYVPNMVLDQTVYDGISAGICSMLYQCICNPIDVVVQRMMVQTREKRSYIHQSTTSNGIILHGALKNSQVIFSKKNIVTTAPSILYTQKHTPITLHSYTLSDTLLPKDTNVSGIHPQKPKLLPLKSYKTLYLVHKFPSFGITYNIYVNEGIGAFYRGFVSSSIQFGIHSTIWYGSFAYFMQIFIPFFEQLQYKLYTLSNTVRPLDTTTVYNNTGINLQKKLKKRETMWSGYPWLAQITSAIISGMLSVFLTNPLDVCRTRYMVNGRTGDGSSFTKVFISLLKNEGSKSLMLGVVPRMLSFAPVSAFIMTIYQASKLVGHEVYLKRNNSTVS